MKTRLAIIAFLFGAAITLAFATNPKQQSTTLQLKDIKTDAVVVFSVPSEQVLGCINPQQIEPRWTYPHFATVPSVLDREAMKQLGRETKNW